MKIHGNHWISWFLVIFKNYLFYKHVLTAHSVQIPQNIHRDERLPSVPTPSARAQIMGVVWTEQDESIWKMGKIRKIIKIMKFHWFSLIFDHFLSFLMISHQADAPHLTCAHPCDASPIIANRSQTWNNRSTSFPVVSGHENRSSSHQMTTRWKFCDFHDFALFLYYKK